MSVQSKCVICKHYGIFKDSDYNRCKAYNLGEGDFSFNLCRYHTVDYFKMGQGKFMILHEKILNGVVGSDEYEFLSMMKSIVKKYKEREAKASEPA